MKIVREGKAEKKIVIWNEILVDNVDPIFLRKVIVFLIDWYLAINEDEIIEDYSRLSNVLKDKPLFEYRMLTDYGPPKRRRIGGFRLSVLDKWCGFYAAAISDRVSTMITGEDYFFKRRANFLDGMLKANSVTFEEFIMKRNESDMEYFYSVISERLAKAMGFWGIMYENSTAEKFAQRQLRKFNLEKVIYDYINYLYYENRMDKFNEDEVEEIMSDLLSLCGSFYDPDVKVDFRNG